MALLTPEKPNLMMDTLLSLYKKDGVKFVTLAQAQKHEVYAVDPGVVGKFGSEIQFQILRSKGLSLKDIGVESIAYPGDELTKVCE